MIVCICNEFAYIELLFMSVCIRNEFAYIKILFISVGLCSELASCCTIVCTGVHVVCIMHSFVDEGVYVVSLHL